MPIIAKNIITKGVNLNPTPIKEHKPIERTVIKKEKILEEQDEDVKSEDVFLKMIKKHNKPLKTESDYIKDMLNKDEE